MKELIDRLKTGDRSTKEQFNIPCTLFGEAANAIEKLQAELDMRSALLDLANDGHVEWQKKAEELQVENAQLRKERDVAVAELKGVCRVRKHSRPHKEYSGMHTCKFRDCIAHKGRVWTCKHWEWRGVPDINVGNKQEVKNELR